MTFEDSGSILLKEPSSDDIIRIPPKSLIPANERSISDELEPVEVDIPINYDNEISRGLAEYRPRTNEIVIRDKLLRRRHETGLVKACLRHEGSHFIFNNLPPNVQSNIVTSFAESCRNNQKLPDFLENFLHEYHIEMFYPGSNFLSGIARMAQQTGCGYHDISATLDIEYRGSIHTVSIIGILDELLAWNITHQNHEEAFYPANKWRRAETASSVIDHLDPKTLSMIKGWGFLDISSRVLLANFDLMLAKIESEQIN